MIRPLLARLHRKVQDPRLRYVALWGGLLGGGLLPLALFGMLELRIATLETETQALRAALHTIQAARPILTQEKEQREQIVRRYRKKAPPLAGFLEEIARAQKLQVSDSIDRPPVAHGKQTLERTTVIHLKKVGLRPYAQSLEQLAQSGYPLVISRMNLRKRPGEPDAYDIELGVSAYDRNELPRDERPVRKKGIRN